MPTIGQRLSFGVIAGGYPTRDFVETRETYTIDFGQGPTQVPSATLSKRGGYIVGLQAGVGLTSRLSLSFGGMYKPLLYRAAVEVRDGLITGYAPAPVITWQFPLLAQYRFGAERWRPFIEGGPSLRKAGNLNAARPSPAGLTAGFGIERQWGRLKLAPRIRYTHWQQDPNSAGVRTEQNQVELLVGLGYASPELAHPLGRRFSFGAMVVTNLTADLPTQEYFLDTPEFSFTGTTTSLRSAQVGPFLEVNLWRRVSVEANAIPRKYRLVTRYSNVAGSIPPYINLSDQPSVISNFWEIPVLAKYRLTPLRTFHGIPLQPFVALGPSFRTTKEVSSWRLSPFGATGAVGVEFRWGQIRLAPELRLTHWGLGSATSPYYEGTGSPIHRNQAQAMLSMSF
ncbi:MAG: hypothetical protein KIT09_29015 [Bryobacteraceae bacterium]|nr:hypothetical protein [Bryobacteraceae bacterium]